MKLKSKHIILGAAAVLLVAVCVTAVCALATEEPIDECLKVAESVRISDDEVITYTGSDENFDGKVLCFESDIARYEVSAENNKLVYIRHKNVEKTSFTVSVDEARNIAAEYARKYRPDMNIDEMELCYEKIYESRYGYGFGWNTIVNGVDINRTIYVNISGEGEFCSFMCHGDEKIIEPDMSKVTVDKEKAEEIATNYFGDYLVSIDSIGMRLMDGKVVWEVDALCDDAPGEELHGYYGLIIDIDAETGEILGGEQDEEDDM